MRSPRISYSSAAAYVARRSPFRCNSMYAYSEESPIPTTTDPGYLPEPDAGMFKAAIEKGVITYLVKHHDTPIGWVERGVGWVIPDHKYSTTMTRAQNILREVADDEVSRVY